MWHPRKRKQSYGLAHIGSNVFKFFDLSWSSLLREFCRNSVKFFVRVLERFRLEKVNGHRHSSGILQEFRSRLVFPTKSRLFFIGEIIRENSEKVFLFCEKTFGDLVFLQKKKGYLRIMYTRQSMACGRVNTSRKLQRACGNHFESNLLCACGGNFAHILLKKWLEFSYLLS